jgi:hypothetical protein
MSIDADLPALAVTGRAARRAEPNYMIGLQKIAAEHRFSLEQLRKPGRFRRNDVAICAARSACYRFLRARGWSLSRIGRFFHRHHTTVLWHLYDPEKRAALVKKCSDAQRAKKGRRG